MPFVKIDCGILDSTLWFDKDARDVFMTALLMAEPIELREPVPQFQTQGFETTGFIVPVGWYGFVPAASVGIFNRAKVSDEAGFKALDKLGAPESNSRTPDFEGRRMVRVEGGFVILNYDKYRERDYTASERMKRYRQRMLQRNEPVLRRNVTGEQRHVTQAEVEEEVDTEVPSTSGESTYRTGSDPVVSRAENANGNGLGRIQQERKQGDGAQNGTPRDHAQHSICGGPASKFCITYNQYDSLAKRYHGSTPEETRTALETFHAHVLTQIPDGKVAGDMVWLLKHFDAWLIDIGRVAPTPVKSRKPKVDRAALIAEVEAAQKQKQARR